MKLTLNDVDAALKVLEDSEVCTNSLKEDGTEGKANAYCIMGTLIAGIARNRHISFNKAKGMVGADFGLEKSLTNAFDSDKRLHYLINGNDSHCGTRKYELKRWQGRKINLLRNKLLNGKTVEI